MAKLNLSGIRTIRKLVLFSHPFTPIKIEAFGAFPWKCGLVQEATKIICASPAFKDEIIHRRTSDR
jgi:hypothetical protein